ncbi:ATP-binding protein [Streptomyces sp. NPDC048277]|uniref:ATP-binding protein n=1 Tax=Streptomyces sp. NPDC048277 TaxID=3155027 RepID=UPI0033F94FFC
MNQQITQTTTPIPTHQFTVLLSSTRRGARLARLLTVQQLADWGRPSDAAAQIVAELAANAVLHGHVTGRDFRLTLALSVTGTLRIAVTDTRGERIPHVIRRDSPDAETGRGLLLVEAYSDRWGTDDGPAPCKTVWAELDDLERPL